jgi:hypothetical protein
MKTIVLIIYIIACIFAGWKIRKLMRKESRGKLSDDEYLDDLIGNASPHWKGVDAEKWLNEIRGDYDE